MANSTTTTDPQRTGLFAALRSADADVTLAYNAVEEIRGMAGANNDSNYQVLTARIDSLEATLKAFDAKFDTKFEARFDAVNSKINSLFWIIGILIVPVSMSVIGIMVLLQKS